MLVMEVFFIVTSVRFVVAVAMCVNSCVLFQAAKSFAEKASFYFLFARVVHAVPFPGG